MSEKTNHKHLKKQVNEVEQKRNYDRTDNSWYDLKTLKKLKLKAKDKLYEIKQKLHA